MIDYNEYWKSCITNRNDFPELLFTVLGGGEVFGSLKFDFFQTKNVVFETWKIHMFRKFEAHSVRLAGSSKLAPSFVVPENKTERLRQFGLCEPLHFRFRSSEKMLLK